ncbi:hypothetical protein [Mannheimia pernigra]|uniref:hypothetical protein n=1 Tax=Mannheimia pernigra TaxID=111844 RepID=UPI00159F495D|nr:hypothetical protein [Mannheimia pernigra]QLB43498.1 hypothetical protein HV561_01285 [Mannheimia pernigra]
MSKNAFWKILILINTAIWVVVFVKNLGYLPQPITEKIKEWTNFTINSPIEDLDKKVSHIEKSLKESQFFWGNEYHNLVTKTEFNQYSHLKRESIDWIVSTIKKLNKNTNLSQEIKYWQNQYEGSPNFCNHHNYHNSDICREIRDKIFNLQLKLDN